VAQESKLLCHFGQLRLQLPNFGQTHLQLSNFGQTRLQLPNFGQLRQLEKAQEPQEVESMIDQIHLEHQFAETKLDQSLLEPQVGEPSPVHLEVALQVAEEQVHHQQTGALQAAAG